MASTVHFLYVLRCADGTFYTGYSTDPERRCGTHNRGAGAKYTRSRRPVTLVAQASFSCKHDALSAEWHFKRLSHSSKERAVALFAQSPEAFERFVAALTAAGPSGEKNRREG